MEDDIDEAQSLAAKYVQRSPTVPIKVIMKIIKVINLMSDLWMKIFMEQIWQLLTISAIYVFMIKMKSGTKTKF